MTMFTNLDQQIIPQITTMRNSLDTRECPSRTYSWPVFILSKVLVEIPWQNPNVTTFVGVLVLPYRDEQGYGPDHRL